VPNAVVFSLLNAKIRIT